MNGAVETFDVSSLNRDEVLRYLGYAGQQLTDDLDARIDDVIARCLEAIRPVAIWRTFDVAAAGERPDGVFAVTLPFS